MSDYACTYAYVHVCLHVPARAYNVMAFYNWCIILYINKGIYLENKPISQYCALVCCACVWIRLTGCLFQHVDCIRRLFTKPFQHIIKKQKAKP